MKVFKFGGASIQSAERIKNVANIIAAYKETKLLVVISAMGKTTNMLEKVAEAFYAGNKTHALELFEEIKMCHINTSKELTPDAAPQLADIFTEIEWLLHDKPVRDYDYYYDQIVCSGELLSTAIINHYLQHIGLSSVWVDVRDIIRTDNNFRDAGIQWDTTTANVQNDIIPLLNDKIIITQGFVGSTEDNESTTLGREGSDYTAAIFANLLDAESQTIWKDVEGVMNADPKKIETAQFIEKINYREIIEMAYYGAQVIHPKTIKPLQNKSIPLHVRCFLKPELKGTIITNDSVANLPPIIVIKENQVLIQLNSKDFSFVEDNLVGELHRLMKESKIRPTLTQNGAIGLIYCFDDKPEKIEKLALAAADFFDVVIERNLTLLTIRHYNDNTIEDITKGKEIILEQKTAETVQMVVKPTIERYTVLSCLPV